MNTVELLLKADAGKIDAPEKEIELTRLSKKFGGPMIFKLKALSHGQYENIMGSIKANVKGDVSVDTESDKRVALAGIVDPNLKDHTLMEHFKAVTPEELLKKLLLPGEIATLSQEIMKLSGFNDTETIKEVKN